MFPSNRIQIRFSRRHLSNAPLYPQFFLLKTALENQETKTAQVSKHGTRQIQIRQHEKNLEDGRRHGIWMAFAMDDGDMEYALNEESCPTKSSLLNVLKNSLSSLQQQMIQSHFHAIQEIKEIARWKICKQRFHEVHDMPCFDFDGICFYCKRTLLCKKKFKVPDSFSMKYHQALSAIAGEKRKNGKFASIKYLKF
jgi:hypothetical protein